MFTQVLISLFLVSPVSASSGKQCASQVAFSDLRSDLIAINSRGRTAFFPTFESLKLFEHTEENFELLASVVTKIKLWDYLTPRDRRALRVRVLPYVHFLSDTEGFFEQFQGKLDQFDTDFLKVKKEIELAKQDISEWNSKIQAHRNTIATKGDSMIARFLYSGTISRSEEDIRELTFNVELREGRLRDLEIKSEELTQKGTQFKAIQIIFNALKAGGFKGLKSHPIFNDVSQKVTAIQTKKLLTYFLLLDFVTQKKQISEKELEALEKFVPNEIGELLKLPVPASIPSYFLKPKTVNEIRHFFWLLAQENLEAFDSPVFYYLEGVIERSIKERERGLNQISDEIILKNGSISFLQTPQVFYDVAGILTLKSEVDQLKQRAASLNKDIKELKILSKWVKRIRYDNSDAATRDRESQEQQELSDSDREWYQIIDFLSSPSRL